MSYLLLKYLHILSAILMLGTTLCNGLLRMHTNRSRQNHHIAVVSSGVTVLNRFLLGPSLILLLLTGLAMTLNRWSFQMTWIQWTLGLYGFLLVAFVRGYALERRLELLAHAGWAANRNNPDEAYWQTMRRATPIGAGATLISLVMLYLMLAKPM